MERRKISFGVWETERFENSLFLKPTFRPFHWNYSKSFLQYLWCKSLRRGVTWNWKEGFYLRKFWKPISFWGWDNLWLIWRRLRSPSLPLVWEKEDNVWSFHTANDWSSPCFLCLLWLNSPLLPYRLWWQVSFHLYLY